MRKRSPIMDKIQARVRVLIRPILSESVPARSLPPALKSARTETARLAAAVSMPIMPEATEDAWEIIIIPQKAPHIRRNSME